jgi:hypothetical protein
MKKKRLALQKYMRNKVLPPFLVPFDHLFYLKKFGGNVVVTMKKESKVVREVIKSQQFRRCR